MICSGLNSPEMSHHFSASSENFFTSFSSIFIGAIVTSFFKAKKYNKFMIYVAKLHKKILIFN